MSATTNNFRIGLFCLLLSVLTLVLYWPVQRYDFVNYDDPVYVSQNLKVQGGLSWEGTRWAFTAGHASNWHPLTWLSHMVDVQLFGLKPGWHHLISVLFHTANSILLLLVFLRMTATLWPSFLVAALFAWHPLHVESVAWISERKDVLSTCFWLVTLWFYSGYAHKQQNGLAFRNSYREYALALIFFAFGLMSKAMLVTLPFILVLIDYWPLRRASLHVRELSRWKQLVLEKIPFFALALASCIVTYLVQKKGGAIASLDHISMDDRLCNAIVAYGLYLQKTLWPAGLAVFYPHPGAGPKEKVLLYGFLLLLITAAVIWQARRRPYLPVGWLWYVGTLVPVIGLVQVGDQAYADRYTYVPLTGAFVLLAWGLNEWVANSAGKRVGVGLVTGALLVVCLVMTHRQLQHWRNGETLFRHALAVTERNYVAHNNLANMLSEAKKLNAARAHYEAALVILPTYEDAHLNLGRLLVQQGDTDGGIAHFTLGVTLKPKSPEGHYNLATALASQGKYEEAISSYQTALDLNRNHTNAHYNLGIALTKLSRFEEAEHHYREALRLDPRFTFAHYNLALALQGLNRWTEAREHLERATQLDPNYLPAKNELGAVLLALEQFEAAVAIYRQVLQSDPNSPPAHNNLGLALARLGKPEAAAAHFREVVRLEPNNADAHYNLANALVQIGKTEEAAFHYSEVLRLNPQDQKAHEKLDKLRFDLYRARKPAGE